MGNSQEVIEDGRFTEETCNKLGNYVYRLIDPRNGDTFYVGKGKGNRVFDHVNASPKLEDSNLKSAPGNLSIKMSRIHEIRRAGLDVIHIIHRHGIPDESIFEVEAALIDVFQGLSNIAGGHGSNDRGPMHSKQIIDKYQLPKINSEPKHSLVLININRLEGSGFDAIYRQTRFSWKISKNRAERANYVLAVIRGVVIAAFEAEHWDKAIQKNFPECPYNAPERMAFKGTKAPKDIWDLYVGERGKQITIKKMLHVQNPILYWDPKQVSPSTTSS